MSNPGSRAPLYNPPFIFIGNNPDPGSLTLAVYFPAPSYNSLDRATDDGIEGAYPRGQGALYGGAHGQGINVFDPLWASKVETDPAFEAVVSVLKRGDLQGRQYVKPYSHMSVYFAQFTRPSDTTAYASGDVVGPTSGAAALIAAAMEVPDYAGFTSDLAVTNHFFDTFLLSDIVVQTDGSPTGLDFDLFLWQSNVDSAAAPVVAAVDNAAFDATIASQDRLIGVVSFLGSGAVALGTGATWQAHGLGFVVPILTGQSDTSLAPTIWYTIVMRGAYTPASAQQFGVKLGALS